MKIKLLIFVFGLALNVHAVDLCEMLLAEYPPSGFFALRAQNDSDQTSSLITYLSRLLDETLIGDAHLVRLSEGLERGEVVNPISEKEAEANYSLLVQRGGLEHLIQSDALDREILLTWIKEKLSQRQVNRIQRNSVEKVTELPIQHMQFVPIPSRTFEMGAFLVTQWQWAMIMKNNPSRFVDGFDSRDMKIGGQFIPMQPNHPVEQVSWEEVQKFIGRLNELSKTDDPLIYKIIPDHVRGKVYRLPTDEEWKYAEKDGADFDLELHGWFSKNSNLKTQAVGLKRPNPLGLFDVHGNVWEWTSDKEGWMPRAQMRSRHGNIPLHRKVFYIVHGGSCSDTAQQCSSMYEFSAGDDYERHHIGFRLARTDE